MADTVSDLCGDVQEFVFFDGVEVTDSSSPVATSPQVDDSTLLIFTDDLNRIDTTGIVTVRGVLVDYPTQIYEKQINVNFIDPCALPAELSVADPTVAVLEYSYTGDVISY